MSRLAYCQTCLGLLDTVSRSRRTPRYCGVPCREAARRRRSDGATGPPGGAREEGGEVPCRYESGTVGLVRHAIGADGVPDADGKRPALCGAWARAGRMLFSVHDPSACRSCAGIAARQPPRRQVQPDVDLACVTALLWRWNGVEPERLLDRLYEVVGRPNPSNLPNSSNLPS